MYQRVLLFRQCPGKVFFEGGLGKVFLLKKRLARPPLEKGLLSLNFSFVYFKDPIMTSGRLLL